MIIFEKKKNGLDKVIKYLKNIPKSLVILLVLIIIAIPLYYRMVTMREPSLEDQMKEYSKQVNAPEMKIDIKFKNFQILLYERDKALDAGGNSPWNMSVKFTEVPAKITFEGKEYKADISLKGSRKDHYSDSTRMAFQVTLKGENTIMGMRKFSLHDPKMRNYVYEWMFHELLRREGFIALKYDFIQVKVNGQEAGVYAIEERPDKILLERYGYVEGPIYKLADDTDSSFFNTVEVFNQKRYNTPEFQEITDKGFQLINCFKEGNLEIDKFANSDMLARYFALCDAFMYFHGTLIKSIRLYYNPVTAKFEPIGFDGHCGHAWPHFISSETLQRPEILHGYWIGLTKFQKLLFFNSEVGNIDFMRKYIKYLKLYSSKKYIDEFYKAINDTLFLKTAILYKNHPILADHFNSFGPEEFKFSRDHIDIQNNYIRDNLNFRRFLSRTKVSARIENNNKEKTAFDLEISNNYSLPLELKKIILNGTINYHPVNSAVVTSSMYGAIREYNKFEFRGVEKIPQEIYSAKLIFSVLEMEKEHEIEIEIYSDDTDKIMINILRKRVDIENLGNYFAINEETKIMKLQNKKTTVIKPLIIPEGYSVFIDSGTEISMIDSAFILSYSPINILGTKENPVKIKSDGTGGMAVINCDSISMIKNTIFSGLSNPRSGEWKLTGSVTFYKSPVIIQNTEFRDNKSEDYLNVKQSSFTIENCRFDNVSSDAFDSDFSDGEITGTVFNNTGNDAIDVSGSTVLCTGNEITGSKDKAYSSGEGSVLKVKNTKISDSEICFAAKDNSKIESSEIEINNCKLGFAAYQKKPEYGPGEISADKVNIRGLKKDMLIEKGSKLRINGKNINGEIEDVKDEYLYGKEFGSPSIR
jgi:hypothetical protein